MIRDDNPFESPSTPSDGGLNEVEAARHIWLAWALPLASGTLFASAFYLPSSFAGTPLFLVLFGISLLLMIAGVVMTIHAIFVRKQWSIAWPHLLAGILLNGLVFAADVFFIYVLISLILFFSSFS